jgi:hypothetical protein
MSKRILVVEDNRQIIRDMLAPSILSLVDHGNKIIDQVVAKAPLILDAARHHDRREVAGRLRP